MVISFFALRFIYIFILKRMINHVMIQTVRRVIRYTNNLLIQLFYVLYTNYIDLGNSFLSRYSTAEYHVHIILLYTQWCKLKLACQTIERLRKTNVRIYEVYQLRLAGTFILEPYFVI